MLRSRARIRRLGPWILAATALTVASCDRVDEACILARATDATMHDARGGFAEAMKAIQVDCYPPLDSPGPGAPGNAEYLLFCEAPPAISVELGRAGDLVFVTLHLLSDGAGDEPEKFGQLRDTVARVLADVVGSENVETFSEIDRCPRVPEHGMKRAARRE